MPPFCLPRQAALIISGRLLSFYHFSTLPNCSSSMNHHGLFLVISALPWIFATIPSSLYGQCGGCGAGSAASGSAAGAMTGPLNQSTDAGLVNPSGSAQNVTFGESTATIPPGSNKASFTNEGGAIPPQPGEAASFDGVSAGNTAKKPDTCPPESQYSGTDPNAPSTGDPQKEGKPSTNNNLDKAGSTYYAPTPTTPSHLGSGGVSPAPKTVAGVALDLRSRKPRRSRMRPTPGPGQLGNRCNRRPVGHGDILLLASEQRDGLCRQGSPARERRQRPRVLGEVEKGPRR